MSVQDLTFTLAQINPSVGALEKNAEKIKSVWKKAETDLVIFPELVITGYPPEDLVLRPSFIDDVEKQIQDLLKNSKTFKSAALIGAPWRIGGLLYNAALLIENGEIKAVQAKYHLPNYGVFDEKRIFNHGILPKPVNFRGCKLGILICEDMWYENIAGHLSQLGADILISINASPYTIDKQDERLLQATARVRENHIPLICVNQIGGQDELVFDGASFVLNERAEKICEAPSFVEHIAKISLGDPVMMFNLYSKEPHIYEALTLGVRDYVEKNGFSGVLIGLSGGVDSALAACIAVDALGASKVHCVMMPSPYTSQDSLDDAEELAKNLACAYEIIPIEKAMTAFENSIDNLSGTAHENMQSRARGLILMSLSNMNGKMVLTTGNKSEMAVGYATLYGDMCGGFNPLKDIYKTEVYKLCAWRNKKSSTIPERILTKAPSAELKDNQSDQDSLPPYEMLDDILKGLIEKQFSVEDIVANGHDRDIVEKVWSMFNRAEYKRRQAPPGPVITSKAFGRDRRYPITNGYK